MALFSRKKTLGVQSLVIKIVNNNCPELKALIEGPRSDSRVNLVMVAIVIPLEKDKLLIQKAFTAITKEFSTTGVALVLDGPLPLDHVILGFRFEGEMNFVHAQAKHLSPMGGGFFQLGFQLLELASPSDYPQLESMSF